jgi:hypothetical protein
MVALIRVSQSVGRAKRGLDDPVDEPLDEFEARPEHPATALPSADADEDFTS